MSTATAETLRAARALIDAPEKWTNKYFALDRSGCDVSPTSGNAVRFGAIGALAVALDTSIMDAERSPAALALHRATGVPSGSDLYKWEMVHWHEDMLAAFDRAIAAEEATP